MPLSSSAWSCGCWMSLDSCTRSPVSAWADDKTAKWVALIATLKEGTPPLTHRKASCPGVKYSLQQEDVRPFKLKATRLREPPWGPFFRLGCVGRACHIGSQR